MVFSPGRRTEAGGVKPGQLLDMFDSSWKVRSIWDGVKLEVVEPDRCPVVLHSFTHLDPDLPLVEVRKRKREAVPLDSLVLTGRALNWVRGGSPDWTFVS